MKPTLEARYNSSILYKEIEKIIHTSLTLNDLSVKHNICDFENMACELKDELIIKYEDRLVSTDITKIYNI
jgi:hypothetical protein